MYYIWRKKRTIVKQSRDSLFKILVYHTSVQTSNICFSICNYDTLCGVRRRNLNLFYITSAPPILIGESKGSQFLERHVPFL